MDVGGGKREVLTCDYSDASTSFNRNRKPAQHQEPEIFFTESQWNQHKMEPSKWYKSHSRLESSGLRSFDQQVRLQVFREMYALLPRFFDTFFPGADPAWSIVHGALIGVLRAGATIPWDEDGDMAVDSKTICTEEAFQKLIRMSADGQAVWMNTTCSGAYCGDAMFVRLPKAVDPTGSVVFALRRHRWKTHSKNKNECGGHPMARFIHLPTGFFIEVLDGASHVSGPKVQKCMMDETLVNVPDDAMELLEKFYPLHKEGRVKAIPLEFGKGWGSPQCKLWKCPARPTKAAYTPFQVSFLRKEAGGSIWSPLGAGAPHMGNCVEQAASGLPDTIFVEPTCFASDGSSAVL